MREQAIQYLASTYTGDHGCESPRGIGVGGDEGDRCDGVA